MFQTPVTAEAVAHLGPEYGRAQAGFAEGCGSLRAAFRARRFTSYLTIARPNWVLYFSSKEFESRTIKNDVNWQPDFSPNRSHLHPVS